MSNLINKVQVKTGVDSSNNFDLSQFQATTSCFYAPNITYFHELVPHEKWRIDTRCHVQCLPLIRPAAADIKVHNRFFYVPYFTIMRKFKDFISETPSWNGDALSVPTIPCVNESDIISALSNTDFSTTTTETDHFDFESVSASSGVRSLKIFTPLGRIAYNILLGLGYNINLSLDRHIGTGIKFSALPLLAYLRVWLDWYSNSQFNVHAEYEQFFDNTEFINGVQLYPILKLITKVYFEKDYFTSAQLNPYAPNTANAGEHRLSDQLANGTGPTNFNIITDGGKGTPIIANASTAAGNSITNISKYTLDAVSSLTDYVKRHQLSGLRPFNRILAEYGVAIDDAELMRSTYIGDNVADVIIDSISATNNNEDTDLGEMAGTAQASSKKNFDFSMDNSDATTFGCILCVTTIVPRSSYTDGVKAHCLRTERFDFFTPSFEHLGFSPIKLAELKNNFHGFTPNNFDPTKVFGFQSQYGSYKTATDTISGDFAIFTRKLQFEPWVLKRQFDDADYDYYKAINEDFLVAKDSSVNSPFLFGETDNFILYYMHHVNARLPMHRMFDDYQYSNEGDNPRTATLPNQGNQLT